MKKIVLAVAAASSMFAGAAFAEGGYVGGAIGQGYTNLDCSGAATCNRSDTGAKVFGGYQFDKNLAAEVTYFDFGKARAADSGVSLDLSSSAVGVGLALMGEFAPQWSGVARLGVASVRMKGDATVSSLSGSTSESNTKAYAGLGIGYEVAKGLSLTAAIDISRGEIVGESMSLRLVSVGLSYGF